MGIDVQFNMELTHFRLKLILILGIVFIFNTLHNIFVSRVVFGPGFNEDNDEIIDDGSDYKNYFNHTTENDADECNLGSSVVNSEVFQEQLRKFLEKRKLLTNFEMIRQKRESVPGLERQKRDGYGGPVKYKCKNSHTGLFSFFVVPIILSDLMIDFMTMIMVDIMVDIMITTAAPVTGGGNNNNNNNNNNNRAFKQSNIIANIINTIADTFIPNNGDEDYSDAWMDNIESGRRRRDVPMMDFSALYLNRKSLELSSMVLNPEKGLNRSGDGSLAILKPKLEQFLTHYKEHVSKKKVHSRRKIIHNTNDTLYIDANERSVLQRASHNPSVVTDIIKGLYKEYLRKKDECRSNDDSLCRFLFSCEKS